MTKIILLAGSVSAFCAVPALAQDAGAVDAPSIIVMAGEAPPVVRTPLPQAYQPDLRQRAQTAAPASKQVHPIDITGNFAIVTDYVPRGFSVSNRTPVVQANLEATRQVAPGLKVHAGVLASSVDKQVVQGPAEFDLYAAVSGETGNTSVRFTYWRIVYPSSSIPLDFNEFSASVTQRFGDVSVTLFGLHDEFRGGGTSDWVYLQPAWKVRGTPLVLKGTVGYEDGANWNNKFNWNLGAFYTLPGNVTLGAQYVDTNKSRQPNLGKGRIGEANAVFSITAAF